MATCKEEVRNCSDQNVFICSCIKAALQAIYASRAKSAPIQEYEDALGQQARQQEVTPGIGPCTYIPWKQKSR
ncbi:hypothetical protein NQ317_018922 [Molorchus minor]|uniref:Uncharacterized protein n=1 Tax=Molorchus minor TaxID=1323400 RepID=A0ABQ9IT79_9CUCU|nr:hypothetical protein NQ317_018922 [Molorchus minor]